MAIPEHILKEVAAALDAPRAALPYLPELFADLDALGSSPRRIVNWLEGAGIGADSFVVDLGCGKGAVGIAAANRLGCRLFGIDAFEPFIAEARQQAQKRSITYRCTFEVGDYRRLLRTPRRYDAGLMLSVAPMEVAAQALHRLVKPGGVYIIDDAIWIGPEDSGDVLRAPEARRLFADLGDHLLREHISSPAEVQRMEDRMQRHIRKRATALGRRKPRLRPLLRDMLAAQRHAVKMLTAGPLRPAMWMARRGE